MSVVKNIEVSSSSEKSFDDAIQQGIAKVCETVKNVQGAWIKEQKVGVSGNAVSDYKVVMIVSFVIG